MHGSYAPVRTVGPAGPPVTLEAVKAHCVVQHSDDDDLLTAMLSAAVNELDGWSGTLGMGIVTQSWSQTFDGFPLRLRLPMRAEAVEALTYVDPDGEDVVLAADRYVLRRDALGSFVEPSYGTSWPAVRAQSESVTVEFTCGSDVEDVPAAITASILLRVADLYRNREAGGAASEPNPTIMALLASFQRQGI